MENLIPVEFKNQRVLITKQLAQGYKASETNIKQNFNNHKERFEEGKHYFCLVGNILREFKRKVDNIDLVPMNVNKLYLWTERGALHHAKILDTDEAWQAYEMLEETYFRTKNNIPSGKHLLALAVVEAQKVIEEQNEQLKVMKPKAEFFDAVAESKDAIDIGSAAKVLNFGIGRNKLFEFLRKKGVLQSNNQPYQRYIDCGYFKTIEQKYKKPDGNTSINIKTLVHQKGLNYIRKLLMKNVA